MSLNDQDRDEIRQCWLAVRKLCDGPRRVFFMEGGGFVEPQPPDELYNLPFALAYAVLDQALNKCRDAGAFACKHWQLEKRMIASMASLPWQDYALVDAGRLARNKLAHEAALLTKADCRKYINGIEAELKAWGAI
jgi:hypothetical protein